METGVDGISIEAPCDPSYTRLDSPEVNITISFLTYPSQTGTHVCMVMILWSQSLPPHLVNPFNPLDIVFAELFSDIFGCKMHC